MCPVGAEFGSDRGEGAGSPGVAGNVDDGACIAAQGDRGPGRRRLRGPGQRSCGALACLVSRSISADQEPDFGAQIACRAAFQPIMCTPRDVTKSFTAQRPATTIGEERGAATGSVVSPAAAPRARTSAAAVPSPASTQASAERVLTTSCRRLVNRSKA